MAIIFLVVGEAGGLGRSVDREHALPGWVGDSESMGGRAIGAGGRLCLQGPEEGAMLGERFRKVTGTFQGRH